MFPTRDMNPRVIAAMLNERNRRLEKALRGSPAGLQSAGWLPLVTRFLAAVMLV